MSKINGKIQVKVNGVDYEINFVDTDESAIQALYLFMQQMSKKSCEIGPKGVLGNNHPWGQFDTGPWQAVTVDTNNNYDVVVFKGGK